MHNFDFSIDMSVLSRLRNHPGQSVNTQILGCACSIKIDIPHYLAALTTFYGTPKPLNINNAQQDSGITFNTSHFGLIIHFKEAVELQLHDDEMQMPASIKSLITEFGVLMIKNTFLSAQVRDVGHRNRFPHLKFHYDRSEAQSTVYSMYIRDPFDDEQRFPRIGSTLFIPNIVAYLQSLKEVNNARTTGKGVYSNYDLFMKEDMAEVIGHIAVEHGWDEPEGIGEISIIDNRTVLHASYHKDGHHPGYEIGVRYCC
jgi:hypothetical protein